MSFATLIPLDGLQFRSLPRNAPFIGARHLVRSIHGEKTSAEMKKKKKREGVGEKKIGVRQSMGGRVKRPLTIPFPHAINRTIAANAVNRSNRMFQLHDPALKFGRFHACPRNRSPFLRARVFDYPLSCSIFLNHLIFISDRWPPPPFETWSYLRHIVFSIYFIPLIRSKLCLKIFRGSKKIVAIKARRF